jgi:hypothetical protein
MADLDVGHSAAAKWKLIGKRTLGFMRRTPPSR